jgi:hypothetical protein
MSGCCTNCDNPEVGFELSNARFFVTTNSNFPSFVIDNKGWVGIGTNNPQYPFDVNVETNIKGGSGGDTYFISANSNSIYTTSNIGIGTQPHYTLDVNGDINYTGTLYQNGVPVSIGGNVPINQSPVTEIIDLMQEYHTFTGQIEITESGTHQLGYNISWSNLSATISDMLQVNTFIGLYGSNNERGYAHYSAFVNPTNDIINQLPGMDAILERIGMYGQNYFSLTPKVYRTDSNSVNVVIEWQSSVPSKGNFKIDVLAPITLGKINCLPIYISPTSNVYLPTINMQNVLASFAQKSLTGIGTHQVGYFITWSSAGTLDDAVFRADVEFTLIGTNGVRGYIRTSCFINTIDNGSTLPGLDVYLENVVMKSQNLVTINLAVSRVTYKSIKMVATWTSDIAFSANTDFKLNVYAPNTLGLFIVSSIAI